MSLPNHDSKLMPMIERRFSEIKYHNNVIRDFFGFWEYKSISSEHVK